MLQMLYVIPSVHASYNKTNVIESIECGLYGTVHTSTVLCESKNSHIAHEGPRVLFMLLTFVRVHVNMDNANLPTTAAIYLEIVCWYRNKHCHHTLMHVFSGNKICIWWSHLLFWNHYPHHPVLIL